MNVYNTAGGDSEWKTLQQASAIQLLYMYVTRYIV